jgi:hypothetical protein
VIVIATVGDNLRTELVCIYRNVRGPPIWGHIVIPRRNSCKLPRPTSSPQGVRSLRAGRSHRGFGPAPMHGRGATFVAVASSRPNSARRVATPPWTDSGGLRHSRFNCRCPRRGPDIRGRFTCAPPRRDICPPRLVWMVMSGLSKKIWSRNRRQHHAHREFPFVSASAHGPQARSHGPRDL